MVVFRADWITAFWCLRGPSGLQGDPWSAPILAEKSVIAISLKAKIPLSSGIFAQPNTYHPNKESKFSSVPFRKVLVSFQTLHIVLPV
jgi:hypothetical protein